jgi:hypothetical protein
MPELGRPSCAIFARCIHVAVTPKFGRKVVTPSPPRVFPYKYMQSAEPVRENSGGGRIRRIKSRLARHNSWPVFAQKIGASAQIAFAGVRL